MTNVRNKDLRFLSDRLAEAKRKTEAYRVNGKVLLSILLDSTLSKDSPLKIPLLYWGLLRYTREETFDGRDPATDQAIMLSLIFKTLIQSTLQDLEDIDMEISRLYIARKPMAYLWQGDP